ncbi:hypothetical protein ACJIZ3_018132 [Penstemon smallii]|uniref:4Fe-4S ferredoxin-type domain-containing protein n=1 Tax=Penstemon smallii TaxID=265156 RepID=A0ABD3SY99_9LAMI
MSLNFSCYCYASLYSQFPSKSQLYARNSSNGGLENVKNLIKKTGVPSIITSPLESLQKGNWVKLICGASFEESFSARAILPIRRPWVMISVNDDEDLHFRKAEFDPDYCPVECTRPCENVCPANAISFSGKTGLTQGGVLAERCYGCGRCLPICPYDKIRAVTYIRDVAATSQLLKRDDVDAIEIHTSGRQAESFQELWNGLGDAVDKLRLVAVSLPDIGDLTIPAMISMYATMKVNLRCLNLWQLDGRPMSGDIGRGATREAIAFALRLASAREKPQEKSKDEMMQLNSFDSSHALISGVAFGGYARKIVGRVLSSVQSEKGHACVENYPDYLLKALEESIALVGTVKCYKSS